MDTATTGQERVTPEDEPAAGPEGAVYAVASDPQTITLFESRGHRRQELLRLPVSNSTLFEILVARSPDQRHLAYIEEYDGRYDRRVVVVGDGGRELLSRTGPFAGLVWAPDSRSLVLLERLDIDSPQPAPPRLVSLRLDGGERVTQPRSPLDRLLGFTPDGSELYAVRLAEAGVQWSGEVVTRVRSDTGEVVDLADTRSGASPHLGFRLIPTGKPEPLLGYIRKGEDHYEIMAARPDGREAVVLAPSEAYPGSFAISSDLSSVAFADADGLWVVTGRQETPRQLLRGFDRTWRLEGVDPNGAVWMRHDRYGYALLVPGEGKGLPELTSHSDDPWKEPDTLHPQLTCGFGATLAG